MIARDKIAGAMYGLALGDALGRDTEFMKLPAIRKRYGAHGYMPLPHPALFTDDTQMSLAVSYALESARSLTPRELVRTLTNEFIHWKHHDEPRAPGVTCMQAIAALKHTRRKHLSWTYASVVSSKGCGANMRVLPTAFIPDINVAIGASQLQAALTHGHPVALAATELTALAMRWAAEGVDLIDLPGMLLQRAKSQAGVYRGDWLGPLENRWASVTGAGGSMMTWAWVQLEKIMTEVDVALQRSGQIKDVCAVLGGAWVAEEALACALYFAIKYADNPTLAISMASRTSGDSDSIACITGAIIGARYGQDVWPADWRARIERRSELEHSINYMWRQHVA